MGGKRGRNAIVQNAHVCDIKQENQGRASGIRKVCNMCLKVGKLHRKIVSREGEGQKRCVEWAKCNSDVDGRIAHVGNGLPSHDCGTVVTRRGWECVMKAFQQIPVWWCQVQVSVIFRSYLAEGNEGLDKEDIPHHIP